MAVYPNGRYALSNPGRYFGAAPGLDLYARARGDRLNVYTGTTWDEIIGGSPTGYGLTGIVPPIRSGALSSHPESHVSVTTTANGLMGLPTSGSATLVVDALPADRLPADDTPQSVTGSVGMGISFAVADILPLDDTPQSVMASAVISIHALPVTGEIIASANGTALVNVSCNNPLLVASILGAGIAGINVDALTATLGAMADMSASSEFAISVTSTSRFPVNDSSPLRTGSASVSISGSLIPYAIGTMTGTTQDMTGMTPVTVAQAVWAAVAAEFADAGTMGRKLNDLSGGVDGGGLTPEQSAALTGAYKEALLARQLAGNRAVITNTPDGKIITIYADDGTTVVHTLSISNDGNTREPT